MQLGGWELSGFRLLCQETQGGDSSFQGFLKRGGGRETHSDDEFQRASNHPWDCAYKSFRNNRIEEKLDEEI